MAGTRHSCLVVIASLSVPVGVSSTMASDAVYSLSSLDGPNVISGSQVTLQVTSTYDVTLASTAYKLTADATGHGIVMARGVEPGLHYVGTDPGAPDPFLPELGLPHDLNPATPLVEVLPALEQAWRPGVANDGVAAGTDILLETLTVKLIGRGTITISLTAPDAAETQSDPGGALFETVSTAPGGDAVTFNLALDADFDDDNDVDLTEFGTFQACFSGAGVPADTGCALCDFDGDTDVDRADYALFQSCGSGPDVAAHPACRGEWGGGSRRLKITESGRVAGRVDDGCAAPDHACSDPDVRSIVAAGSSTPQVGEPANGRQARASTNGFVPTTYPLTKTIALQDGHEWLFPVMIARGTDGTDPASLIWQTDFSIVYATAIIGKYFYTFPDDSEDTFGLVIHDGSTIWPQTPPAATQMVEYNGPACAEVFRNPNTPLPPSFVDAKAAADQYCVDLCGDGFEMTDFDMNQWQYTCFSRIVGTPKAYQVAAWGGSQCEKKIDNGLIQACNPITGVIAVRQNLGGPLGNCPECDVNGDGVIALDDLIAARNEAYGPHRSGAGYTFALVRETGTTIDQAVDLTQFMSLPNSEAGAIHVEITHWNSTTPVDCNAPGMNHSLLHEVTEPAPGGSQYLGQRMADDYCGPAICSAGGLGYTIGHCRINDDGTHSIRITLGFCYDCL